MTIAWLYPEHLSLYGDRGNVLALMYRLRLLGVEPDVLYVNSRTQCNLESVDIFFMGGGQDSEQQAIHDDLLSNKSPDILKAVRRGAVFLGVCAGYQFLGNSVELSSGTVLQGLGLLDVHTEASRHRKKGSISIQPMDPRMAGSEIRGFENHSGLTFLGKHTVPFGTVRQGNGNNGLDRTEGAICGRVFGTYLHGPLLPSNPDVTNYLIQLALDRNAESHKDDRLVHAGSRS